MTRTSAEALRAAFDTPSGFTVGLEEEVMVLHPETLDLLPRAPELLPRLDGDTRVTLELPAAQRELIVGPEPTVPAAVAALGSARTALVDALVGDARPACAGLHPFAAVDGPLTPGAYYAQSLERRHGGHGAGLGAARRGEDASAAAPAPRPWARERAARGAAQRRSGAAARRSGPGTSRTRSETRTCTSPCSSGRPRCPPRRAADGLRGLGLGADATRFFDEHVAADAVHAAIAAGDLAGGLARAEPELGAQILWGAACLAESEGRWAAGLLRAWETGDSSLRPALPVSV